MLGKLLTWSISHRRTVLFAAALLLAIGAALIPRLNVDVLPDITRPALVIMSEATGLAAEEVENRVTRPVEFAMAGLPRALRVRASTIAGVSIVSVELDWGSNVVVARQLAAERLAQARSDLPASVIPQIQPVSSIMGEIMLVAVTGKDLSAFDLRTIAERRIRPRIAALTGISQVTVIGGGMKEIVVKPDLAALQAREVTLSDLGAALSGIGANVSGGVAQRTSGAEGHVRAIGEADLATLGDTVVVTREGQPVLVRDVARVEAGPAPARGAAGMDGDKAVILSVQKQPGADTLALSAGVDYLLSSLAPELKMSGATSSVLFRQAAFISTALVNVQRLLIEAGVVVAIVLLVFLGGWRPTLVSLAAIPLSLVTAVLILTVAGVGIDVMVLGGFAIALGELVDDAVVDVENVARRLRRNALGDDPAAADDVVLAGSLEVRSGLVQATAIIMLVLVPLLLLPGVEGRLLRPLALAYVAAMGASLIVALTLTPVLCAYVLPIRAAHRPEPAVARRLRGLVEDHLPEALRRRREVMLGSLALVALSAASFFLLPRALMPPFNEGALTVTVATRPGIGLDESSKLGAAAERLISRIDGVAATGRRTGRAAYDEHTQGVETSEIDVRLSDPKRRDAVAADIRRRLASLPAIVSVGQPVAHRIDHMTSGLRAQFALKLYGPDLEALESAASELQSALILAPGLVDIGVERVARVPTTEVRPDARRAALWGVPGGKILEAAEYASGKVLSTSYEEGFRVDVVLRLSEADRSPDALAALLLDTAEGRAPLSTVADVVPGATRTRIERENGERRVAITANFQGADTAETLSAVEDILRAIPLPPGARAAIEGNFIGQTEAVRHVAWSFVTVLLLVYAGLVWSYRSAVLAAIVLGSIPLAFVGGVAALLITGQPLSLASIVGFVALAGIAARNGILKVNHVADRVRLDRRAFGPEVVVEAGRDRIIPVTVTALAAAVALLPILITGSAVPGSELLFPVAAVVFGGLISATLLDCLVIPALLAHFGASVFETASG